MYNHYELSIFLSTVQIFYPSRSPPHSCTLWVGLGVRGLGQEVCAWVCVLWAGKLCLKNGFNIQGLTPKLIKDKLVKALGFSLSLSSKKESTCLDS